MCAAGGVEGNSEKADCSDAEQAEGAKVDHLPAPGPHLSNHLEAALIGLIAAVAKLDGFLRPGIGLPGFVLVVVGVLCGSLSIPIGPRRVLLEAHLPLLPCEFSLGACPLDPDGV